MTRRTLWIVVVALLGLLGAGVAVLVLRHNVAANSQNIDRLRQRAATTVTGAPGPPGPPGSTVTITVPVRVGGSSTGTTSPGTRPTTSTSPTTTTTRPPSTTTTRCTVAVTGHCIVPN